MKLKVFLVYLFKRMAIVHHKIYAFQSVPYLLEKIG